MTLETELKYHQEQLQLVRKQITKLRNTQVSSYSHAGNSANYRSIDELVKDENRLLRNIAKLEAALSGKNTRLFFAGGIRIR